MRIGSLFAGYGGLEMGVQGVWPDAELAWYSEIDKGALKVLEHHHPDVPNIGDVTAVDWSQVEPVDILTGGSPCQDLSHAGNRQGMTEGTRSNLWVAMATHLATAVEYNITRNEAQWGDYAAAIARWEHVLGRPAPAPTQTSTKGNPQLAPAFVEWMMGLPAGWVADAPGITRNEALKALGNGVVPQQAEAAIRWLLARIKVAA